MSSGQCLSYSLYKENQHWINPKQYASLYRLGMSMLSYSYLEILIWQPTYGFDAPQTFLRLLEETYSDPEIKIKHDHFIIIILFWGLYKSSLIKKEYIIAYLTLHITTSPLSFALKYYHASKYCLFFFLIYKWCHLTSADKYWRRFIVAASKNILTEYINRTMANKIMISVLSRTVVYTVRTGCYFFVSKVNERIWNSKVQF